MRRLWVTVKCGLVRDAKHRRVMGEAIWLYEYMLDLADWSDGIVHEWKDEDAAKDIEMPVRTLIDYRRRLAEAGYITCIKKQYSQDIAIHNWTNPREYTGKVYNRRQSAPLPSVSEDQTDTQSDTQTNSQNVGPTSNPKNQISNTPSANSERPKDLVDLFLDTQYHPAQLQQALADHFKLTPNWEAKYNRQFMEWAVDEKITPEQVRAAADLWRSDKRFNWQVPTLRGIQEHWLDLRGKPKKPISTFPDFDENGRVIV